MNSQLNSQQNFNFNEAVFEAVRKIPAGRVADAFSFAGPIEQKIRLNAEGVEVSADYRVDLKKYGI